ncbi:DNA polymerase III subunit gamma and tau [Microbacterium sp. LRZ72]|uniref:DNA polymerase III subunit gamma and tau n=1 Tax=Microbacterium sp. LRZ72 TaxID=2942481 RepID=UPI0039B02249
MIGQAQVTDPLMTALRNDRVGHAYLFSGPRGCGKTTSARILARCLNCAEGPTDRPCGRCDSCVELSRSGGGSLDVVEIDAASHNGVDDARDLRERAIFAPARDRYKIFILDEAHMVTQQGFNALLKLVEEPPDHVKFIFATTEPEKVLGTIRSRTHHYPFRLVPPGPMLEYVQQLCESESVDVESGVLPLVVRAGGGSPRDTLSLLDQLMAGSDAARVEYERAVALLGYTHAELLDEVVDALAAAGPAAAFGAVDRVVQTGQDPRRFVDDLLERLRDLIVVEATGAGASAVLRGVPAEELERMGRQAAVFGARRLSRIADLVSATLDDMSGATSPRLHLELMIARVLAEDAAADDSVPAPRSASEEARRVPDDRGRAGVPETPAPNSSAPAAGGGEGTPRPVAAPAAPEQPAPPVSGSTASDTAWTSPADGTSRAPASGDSAASTPASTPAPSPVEEPDPVPQASGKHPGGARTAGPVTLARMRDSWPEVLAELEGISRASWLVASNARIVSYDDGVLALAFQSQSDVATFRTLKAGAGASEDLRDAIDRVLGVRVKYLARLDGPDAPPPPRDPHDDSDPGSEREDEPPAGAPRPSDATPDDSTGARPASGAAPRPAAAPASAAPVTEWAVAQIPADGPAGEPSDPGRSGSMSSAADAMSPAFAVDDDPEEAAGVPPRVATLAPPAEGAVIEERAPIDDDDDEDVDMRGPARAAAMPAVPAVASAPTPTTSSIDRYGEAVVRQVLGATFLHEERHEPPTRFS